MLRLNNLKTRTAMNAKNSVFVICVKGIIYLLLYNLHDCTFNNELVAASSIGLYYLRNILHIGHILLLFGKV